MSRDCIPPAARKPLWPLPNMVCVCVSVCCFLHGNCRGRNALIFWKFAYLYLCTHNIIMQIIIVLHSMYMYIVTWLPNSVFSDTDRFTCFVFLYCQLCTCTSIPYFDIIQSHSQSHRSLVKENLRLNLV